MKLPVQAANRTALYAAPAQPAPAAEPLRCASCGVEDGYGHSSECRLTPAPPAAPDVEAMLNRLRFAASMDRAANSALCDAAAMLASLREEIDRLRDELRKHAQAELTAMAERNALRDDVARLTNAWDQRTFELQLLESEVKRLTPSLCTSEMTDEALRCADRLSALRSRDLDRETAVILYALVNEISRLTQAESERDALRANLDAARRP